MTDPRTILIGIPLLAIAIGFAHMATEARDARRLAQWHADRAAQEFAAPRPAPRPTVEDDWHRPDVKVFVTANGDFVSQEIEA